MANDFMLEKVRLGRHERRILLLAPVPGAAPRRIEPPVPGRVADEAHRRALRSLARHGLVELGQAYCPALPTDTGARERAIQKHEQYAASARLKGWTYNGSPLISARRRTVRLTPLGAAVVSAAGGAIQGQQRIRWAKYRDRILQDCSGNE